MYNPFIGAETPAPPRSNPSKVYSYQHNAAAEHLEQFGLPFNRQDRQGHAKTLNATRHCGHEIRGDERIDEPRPSNPDFGEDKFTEPPSHHIAAIDYNAEALTSNADTSDREYSMAHTAKNMSPKSNEELVAWIPPSVDPRMLETKLTPPFDLDDKALLVEDRVVCTLGSVTPDSSGTDADTKTACLPSQGPLALVERYVSEVQQHFNKWKATKTIALNVRSSPPNSTTHADAVGTQDTGLVGTVGGDNTTERRRDRKREGVLDEAGRIRLLACPFCKLRPSIYENCIRKKFRTIARLKEHIRRCHLLPIRCSRCYAKFRTIEERDQHVRKGKEEQCELLESTDEKGYDPADRSHDKAMRQRANTKITTRAQWNVIFSALLAGEPLPDSPWFDEQLANTMQAWQQFIREEWLAFRDTLDWQSSESLRNQQGNVRDLMETVLETVKTRVIELHISGRRRSVSRDSAYRSGASTSDAADPESQSQNQQAVVPDGSGLPTNNELGDFSTQFTANISEAFGWMDYLSDEFREELQSLSRDTDR